MAKKEEAFTDDQLNELLTPLDKRIEITVYDGEVTMEVDNLYDYEVRGVLAELNANLDIWFSPEIDDEDED